MRVLIAGLVDHANIAQPGDKLNLFGIFDTVGAASFPVTLAAATLALRLQFENSYPENDGGRNGVLLILIVSQDGKEFGRIEGHLSVPPIAAGARMTMNHLITLRQVTFRSAQRLSIVIKWN